MGTLKYLKELLEVYSNKVENQRGSKEERNSHRDEFILNVMQLRDRFPHLLYPLYPECVSIEEAEDIVNKIKESAKNNYYPIFPTNGIYIDAIEGDIIESPAIYSFLSKSSTETTSHMYEEELDEWIMKLLLSLPLGKIELKCVNFNTYGYESYHGKSGSNVLKTELETIIKERKQKYGNYVDFCYAHKQIPEPYIIIILKDDHRGKYNKTESYFRNLYNKSAKAGIYFVVLLEEKEKEIPPQYIAPLFKDCFHKGKYDINGRKEYIVNSVYGVRIGYIGAKKRHSLSWEEDIAGYPIPICYEDSCDCSLCQNPSVECIKLTSDLDQAHKIKEKFGNQDENFSIFIEKYSNLSVGKTPIIRCTQLSDNKNLKEVIKRYVGKSM